MREHLVHIDSVPEIHRCVNCFWSRPNQLQIDPNDQHFSSRANRCVCVHSHTLVTKLPHSRLRIEQPRSDVTTLEFAIPLLACVLCAPTLYRISMLFMLFFVTTYFMRLLVRCQKSRSSATAITTLLCNSSILSELCWLQQLLMTFSPPDTRCTDPGQVDGVT